MESNKKEEPVEAKPLPRWIRRAFKLKDEKKQEKIIRQARDQGYSLVDIMLGFEEYRLHRDGKPN